MAILLNLLLNLTHILFESRGRGYSILWFVRVMVRLGHVWSRVCFFFMVRAFEGMLGHLRACPSERSSTLGLVSFAFVLVMVSFMIRVRFSV